MARWTNQQVRKERHLDGERRRRWTWMEADLGGGGANGEGKGCGVAGPEGETALDGVRWAALDGVERRRDGRELEYCFLRVGREVY
jgi:hypothetical protein